MFPIVATFFTVALIISPLFFLILGWGHAKAREFIADAVEESEKGDFDVARRLILSATRFNGKLLQNPEIKVLYDLILQNKRLSPSELERFAGIAESWPRTRAEIVWGHPASKSVFFGVIGLGLLARFFLF